MSQLRRGSGRKRCPSWFPHVFRVIPSQTFFPVPSGSFSPPRWAVCGASLHLTYYICCLLTVSCLWTVRSKRDKGASYLLRWWNQSSGPQFSCLLTVRSCTCICFPRASLPVSVTCEGTAAVTRPGTGTQGRRGWWQAPRPPALQRAARDSVQSSRPFHPSSSRCPAPRLQCPSWEKTPRDPQQTRLPA